MNPAPVTQNELVATDQVADANGPPIGFFAVGIVINVLLITAYFVWAWRQGKKPDRRDD